MAEKKKEVFAAIFNRPVQFLGIEGVEEGRVFIGKVEDVPAAVAESSAFATYKEAGWVDSIGDVTEVEEDESEGDPALVGNVATVVENAKDLSKDQLIELKTKEAAGKNRAGVLNGLQELIEAKG